MTPDLVARLSAAMRAGRVAEPDGYAFSGVTGPEKLRLKSPELRQLRELRVENDSFEKINFGSGFRGNTDVPFPGEGSSATGSNPIIAEATVSATTSAGKAARDGEDRSCGLESNFFGRHRAEGVTGVTGVTTDTYTSNRLRPLTVTDPFAPLPYSSYALPFAKLQAESPPSVETIAWRQAIVDSRDFQNRWGRIAAFNGWTADELLTSPSDQTAGGLIWQIRGDVIIRLDARKAIFGSGRIFERASINYAIWSESNCAAIRDRLQKQVALPATVAVHLARLLTVDRFKDYSGILWRRAQAGALTFALEWTPRAHDAGWTPKELFALHPIAPSARYDCKGLAWLLGDRWRVVSIDEDCAVITTTTGASLNYQRKKSAESILLRGRAPSHD